MSLVKLMQIVGTTNMETFAAGAPPAAGSAPEPAALPEGWASTKDAQGRTYFWHKTTKKVQWDRPTADTPIS